MSEETTAPYAARGAAATAILHDPAFGVRPPNEPVPRHLVGTPIAAWYARLARMTDGPSHERGRAAIERALAGFTVERVRAASARCAAEMLDAETAITPTTVEAFARGLPVVVTAVLLGMPFAAARDAVPEVRSLVTALAPDATRVAREAGVAALASLYRRLDDARHGDARANAVGLLVQASEATAALVMGVTAAAIARPNGIVERTDAAIDAFVDATTRDAPPIVATRRFAHRPASIDGVAIAVGREIRVDLASIPDDGARTAPTFGRGPHACPGATAAATIASAALAHLLERGFEPERFTCLGVLPSPTIAMPILGIAAERSMS